MGEGSDQQIATEPLRRARAMQLAPCKPQFLRRPIEQFGNLTVDLGDVCTARSAGPVAASTGNGRRIARALASRRVLGWAVSCARRLGDAVDATAFLFGRSESEAELFL
jgi:hypothetical protein